MDVFAIFSLIIFIMGVVTKKKEIIIIGLIGVSVYFLRIPFYWAMGW